MVDKSLFYSMLAVGGYGFDLSNRVVALGEATVADVRMELH